MMEGHLEGICNMKAVGEEKIQNGKKYFIYTFYPRDAAVEHSQVTQKKEGYEGVVDQLVYYITNKKTSGRKLGDLVHISGEQGEPYFLLKATEGHRILEKYSGVKVGRKIAEKAGLRGVDESLRYIQDMFKHYKLGLLHPPETRGDRLILKMDESAYSSGVQNIHMKLDTWLAGLIEGLLSQATGERWLAAETKCLANGDEHCEFACKRI